MSNKQLGWILWAAALLAAPVTVRSLIVMVIALGFIFFGSDKK